MKRIFFTLIMMTSTALMALSNAPGLSIHDKVSKQFGSLETRKNCHSESSSHRDCDDCPTGPRGPAGPIGNIGPRGPEGRDRIEPAKVYGSFSTTAQVEVDPGDPILFTNISDATRNLTLAVGGRSVIIDDPGDYLVIVGVSAESSSTGAMIAPGVVRYAVTLDNVVFVAGTNDDSLHAGQMTTISTTVRVPEFGLPARLRVINFGTTPFTLFSATEGDLTAFIVVKKLDGSTVRHDMVLHSLEQESP